MTTPPPPVGFARIFRGLGEAFASPEGLLYGSLAAEARDGSSELPPGVARLARELREQTGRTSRRVLSEDFVRLFTGPPPPLAQPYESVYRDAGGRLMGTSAVAARAAYAAAGLRPSGRAGLLPDHVSVECEFVAVLAEREERATRRDEFARAAALRADRERFLGEHLAPFLPPLARAVEAGARTRALRTLGALARMLIRPWAPRRRRTAGGQGHAGRRPDVREGACSLCGACVMACGSKALRIRGDDQRIELVHDAHVCDGCGVCVARCPERAMRFSPALVSSGTRTLARSAPAACTRCGQVLDVSIAALTVGCRAPDDDVLREHLKLCVRCRSRRVVLSAGPFPLPAARSPSP